MRINKNVIGGGAIRSLLITAFVVSLLFILNPVPLMAQNANDTITLDVNISQQAAIEVLPTSYSWNATPPGSNGSVQNVSIKNIGSYNLTNFYIDVNTDNLEETNPIGTGNSTKYAASGFIMLRNETDTLDYFHLGRLEWNLTEEMDTENLNLSANVTNFGHGWYRKANLMTICSCYRIVLIKAIWLG